MSAAPPPAAPVPAKPRRRWLRALLILLMLAVLLGIGLAAWVYAQIKASLPLMEGELIVAGLAAPVQIERDDHGVPTIRAQNKPDLLRALGFLHGQERFFQMDLFRRSAAGELAELFGPGEGDAILGMDRSRRLHRFRSRCRAAYAALAPTDKTLVDGYVAGVNAGLAALPNKPFEYLILGNDPAPWQGEDSFLIVAAMYLSLQSEIWLKESTLGAVVDLCPETLSKWLGWPSDEWDAPLEGGPLPPPPLPSPEEFDLRREPQGPARPSAALNSQAAWSDRTIIGSNSWAVAGSKSAVGPLLCSDMHLDMQLPNIWYRACLVWPNEKEPGMQRRAVGVTLPGGPALVVGSNGQVAWAFTNSQADWADLVLVEMAGVDANVYKTPDGPRLFETKGETIAVKGRPDVQMNVIETVWGPILQSDHRKRDLALRWVAHDLECLNFRMADLLEAHSLEEALAVANKAGGPHQNFVAADRDGRIGWTMLGRIPNRVGFDGRVPRSWSSGSCKWNGYRPPEDAPRLVSPEGGFLWTANARIVAGKNLEKLGFGDYDRGARAKQIRDGLLGLKQANYDDMLKIQLDDRALFLERWQKKLLALLDEGTVAGKPERKLYRDRVEAWGARAAVDSVGYRLVRQFRQRVQKKALDPLTARCRMLKPDFDARELPQPEGPLWKLVSEQPKHLLDPKFESWNALLLSVVDEQLAELIPNDPDLTLSVWGEANRPRIRHPLAGGLGIFGRWLEAPNLPLPGAGTDMPRIQDPLHGASERLAVSPGREEEGYFHMPGGQSGHPLSPHWLDGYDAWARGERTPLLPGPTKHTLKLKPF